MLRPFRNMQYASEPRLVEHPSMRGKVTLETQGDSVEVIFTDKIYVRSPFTMPTSFSREFTDYEILCSVEVEAWLAGITGMKCRPQWSD